MRKMDFFVIGAMKGGTTALHYHLRAQPRIFLPVEKEAPFFSDDALYGRGPDWYLKEYFSSARPGQLIGTVSPQYMTDPRVPKRMHAAFPETKLVALLRDPMARARSHYRMMVRAFNERRPFAEAADGHYAAAGEYGRILSGFLSRYPRERLLVLFSRDFASDPGAVIGRVTAFLGIEGPAVVPAVTAGNSAAAVSSRRLARFAANTIHTRLRPVRPLLKKVLPERYTRRVGLWTVMYRSRVADPSAIDVSLPPERERELARRYLDDLALLERILGEEAPWRPRMEALAGG